ncbi:hypothetical protein [Lentzea cavernae]|uniref:PPE family protein n=1 Tax=Lentzea cavernae TaxID=2020703 RepID=A0ABQ3MIJ1_9PSEU|nr:hypothetical protein [Lentzea cavernae]GHH44109.1 hypothetical protein GCM10017774_43080 [Lentzea cavernae]
MDYRTMPLRQQALTISAEMRNEATLGKKAEMWAQAEKELPAVRDAFKAETNKITAAKWDQDAAGEQLLTRSENAQTILADWSDRVTGAQASAKIKLVADSLMPTFDAVRIQVEAYNEALNTAQSAKTTLEDIETPFRIKAGEALNVLAGYFRDVDATLQKIRGGPSFQSLDGAPGPGGPGAGGPAGGPGGAAGQGGVQNLAAAAGPDLAAAGDAAGGVGGGAAGDPAGGAEAATAGGPEAGAGGAGPGGAGAGGAGAGGVGSGGAGSGGAGSGGVAAEGPSLSGGGVSAPPIPAPTLPALPPPSLPGGPSLIPPMIPGAGPGSPARPGTGGVNGISGGVGGVGGARVPGVGPGGGIGGLTSANSSLPAAMSFGAPANAVPNGPVPNALSPNAPHLGSAGTGPAGAGGVPIMPPMGGAGMGAGTGAGNGPGSGASPRRGNSRTKRRDGSTPGLPSMLSGKAGKADTGSFVVRDRRPSEPLAPPAAQVVDEDLWRVDQWGSADGRTTRARRLH